MAHRSVVQPQLKVVVCDDRPELRTAIIKVLAQMRQFQVVAEASSGPSCLECLKQTSPDVLILDVNMPGGGVEVARSAKRLLPNLHIVVFSGREEPLVRKAMLEAGADQYVVKTGRIRLLVEALDRAANAGSDWRSSTTSLPRQGEGS